MRKIKDILRLRHEAGKEPPMLNNQTLQTLHTVRYFRTSRLLETLSIAHGDGRFAKLIA